MQLELHKLPRQGQEESLKISPSKGTVNLAVNATSFIDNDTKYHVIFVPSLGMTSYGESLSEAEEMMKQNFIDFCEYLMSLDQVGVQRELKKYGWSKRAFFAKQFSRLSVNSDGELDGFNVDSSSIKHYSLASDC